MALRIEVNEAVLADFCRRHDIRKLSFFGSVLRDDFRPGSDVDVLVEFEPDTPVGLLRFAHIQNELSDLLGRAVHLSTPTMLSRYFRDDVLRQAEPYYVAA